MQKSKKEFVFSNYSNELKAKDPSKTCSLILTLPTNLTDKYIRNIIHFDKVCGNLEM